MNPLLLIVLGWLALGLETGLKNALVMRVGSLAGAPSFVVPVVAIVAICSPPAVAMWTALILGFLLDLTAPFSTTTSGQIFLPGPGALGLLLGAQFVLLVRGFVIRRNPLTLVVLSISAGVIAAICTVAIITIRQLFYHDPIEWSATHELSSRLLSAVITGLTALILGIILLPLTPLLGLPQSQARIRTRR